MSECQRCGYYDDDWGCTCATTDIWYSCPIEITKPENQEKLKEMADWYSEYTRIRG